jgi:hypothetical protein
MARALSAIGRKSPERSADELVSLLKAPDEKPPRRSA